MSTLSEPGTTWYFSSDEQEPFSVLPLRGKIKTYLTVL